MKREEKNYIFISWS